MIAKVAIYSVLFLAGITAGTFGALKLQKPVVIPDQPDCICPDMPAVSVQPFEVDKIKGLREFVYSPQFSGSIQVAGVDSTSIRRMIDASMDRSFQKYMLNDKKKRK